MMSRIMEENLCWKSGNVRGTHFSGSTVDHMNHQIVPALCKNTSHSIICIGKNDASLSTLRIMLNKVLSLESAVQEKYPDCDVWILTPIILLENGSFCSYKPIWLKTES